MNPLKELRQKAGLTLEEVGKATGVSKQYLIYCEKAVYTEPSDLLMNYYKKFGVEFTDYEIRQKYYAYQRETRKFNYGRLIEPWAFNNTEGHPFIQWRNFSGVGSMSAICKLYCVHPAIMQKFEHKPQSVVNVPEQLLAALLESGYKADTLNNLEEAYAKYRERLNEKMEVIMRDA